MAEKVGLVFKDGTTFEWNTSSLRHARKVVSLQRKHGDPKQIVGDGKIARVLREKYKVYNLNPQGYKTDVFGTASKLSGMAKEEVEKKFRKISKRLRWKHE